MRQTFIIMKAILTSLMLVASSVPVFPADSARPFSWDGATVYFVITDRFAHFRKLGRIRKDNPVIATGKQKTIDTHTCLRYDDTDTILIKVKPDDGIPVPVERIFPDGTTVTELYSGQSATVTNGTVTFPKFENRIAILKRLR